MEGVRARRAAREAKAAAAAPALTKVDQGVDRAAAGSSAESAHSLQAGPDHVWYFAFGSNMNPKVLTGRRKVQPVASHPCSLPGYVLDFSYLAFPYSEPGFATIVPIDADSSTGTNSAGTPGGTGASTSASGVRSSSGGASSTSGRDSQHGSGSGSKSGSSGLGAARAAHEARLAAGLHGVAHLIKKEEWAQVQLSEGVCTDERINIGYKVQAVRCQLYDGRWVEAETLVAAPASRGDACAVLPSQRYIQILRDGARHYGVQEAYCAMLDAQPGYSARNFRQKAAKYIVTLLLFGLMVPLVAIIVTVSLWDRVKALLGGKSSTSSSSSSQLQSPTAAAAAATATATFTTSSAAGAAAKAVTKGAAAATAALAEREKGSAAEASQHQPDETTPMPHGVPTSSYSTSMAHPAGVIYFLGASRLLWAVHDWGLCHVCGSGADMPVAAAAAAASTRKQA